MLRRHLRWMTVLLMAMALGSSIGWLIQPQEPRFEAAMAAMVLLASFTGIFADRWAAQQEKQENFRQRRIERQEAWKQRRRLLLIALMHECFVNLTSFKDAMFTRQTALRPPCLYPRLQASALEQLIQSGLFSGQNDVELYRLTHESRSCFQRCNQATGLVEQNSSVVPHAPSEQARIHNELLREQGPVALARQKLIELTTQLRDHYAQETGIDGKTILFPRASELSAAG